MGYGTILFVTFTTWLGTTGAQQTPPKEPPKAAPAKAVHVEKIARLQGAVEKARKELAKLQTGLQDESGDYQKAFREFQALDTQLQKQEKELKKLTAAEDKKARAKLESEHQETRKSWQQAKERLGIAIQERKTQQQKVTALTEKIQQDQQILDQLTGKESAAPDGSSVKGLVLPPPPQTAKNTSPPQPANPPPGNAQVNPVIPGAVLNPGSEPPKKADPDETTKPKPESEELKKAKEDATTKQTAAKIAGEKVQSLKMRIETLRKNILLDQQLLRTSRQKQDLIQKTLNDLQRAQQQNIKKGVPLNAKSWDKIVEERQRFEKTRLEVRKTVDNLGRLQEELDTLQKEQILALRDANRKKVEANSAQQKVAELQNPFAPRNLLQWSLNSGPQVIAILVCMFLFHFLVRIVSRRIVAVVAATTKHKRRKERETEQRAETLVGVFRNFSAIAIWGGGSLMLLETVSIPVVPLMGGAAIIGLAVAFGAQNLIRDYFTGFMILVEDQYAMRDFIQIGQVEGTVEKITMRVTVLRDRTGSVHFIPHGTIANVTNYSHTWSRAFFDIGVAYKEKVDDVMAIIKELGAELRADAEFGPLILEDLQMMGVDAFADSAIQIKFFLKTKPLSQWIVKREMLRRIKNRFDELEIEIPFPHRTVYHRNGESKSGTKAESAEEDCQAA